MVGEYFNADIDEFYLILTNTSGTRFHVILDDIHPHTLKSVTFRKYLKTAWKKFYGKKKVPKFKQLSPKEVLEMWHRYVEDKYIDPSWC